MLRSAVRYGMPLPIPGRRQPQRIARQQIPDEPFDAVYAPRLNSIAPLPSPYVRALLIRTRAAPSIALVASFFVTRRSWDGERNRKCDDDHAVPGKTSRGANVAVASLHRNRAGRFKARVARVRISNGNGELRSHGTRTAPVIAELASPQSRSSSTGESEKVISTTHPSRSAQSRPSHLNERSLATAGSTTRRTRNGCSRRRIRIFGQSSWASFDTACRPGEILSLQWKDVSHLPLLLISS
jgi:hypothetical protein